jgi:large subunit ribosomal protein L4e
MKADILSIEGKKMKTIELPECFNQKVREDLIAKVLETKKVKQPFSSSPVGGKQHSASGILIHQRKVWKSQYGRGMSRIPRKIMSRRGSQFNWEGAEAPNTKGGRRSHPPKIFSALNVKKINKKEMKLALFSALSASANPKMVCSKYEKLKNCKIENLPLVTESKITTLKTKQLIESIKKILGKDLFSVGMKKTSQRSGIGKLRGRKYKKTAGLLLVIGEKEKLKTKRFDIQSTKEIGVENLAKGGCGRLVLYTEQAIKEIGEKLK